MFIFAYSIVITGSTYAFQQLSATSTTAQSQGGCFQVSYTGQDLNAGDLLSTNDYLNGAHTTDTLSKDSTCKIYTKASIYLHTNDSTTAPVDTKPALKYKMFNGDNVVAQGLITNKGKSLLTTVELTDTAVTYTIYFWIDSDLSDGAYHETSYSGYIYAESSQTSTIPTATFLTGSEVNVKMKNLAGDNVSSHVTADTNITAIQYSATPPTSANMTSNNIVSTSDSDIPIYLWYNNGTIYWWSEDSTPSLNSDASYMFSRLSNLSEISGLENFNTKGTTTFLGLFMGCVTITNVDVLVNWDTSNVTSIKWIFGVDGTSYESGLRSSLIDISGVKNWDTSNVTDMSLAFYLSTVLTSLDSLESWDTSNVTNMYRMFCGTFELNDIGSLRTWNTSNVTNMQGMFVRASKLTDISALSNWDVSNVTNMSSMFNQDVKITNISPLKNWDVSNVTDMSTMFQNVLMTSLEPLSNWDVSNVTDMSWMFGGSQVKQFSTLEPLSNWDVSNVQSTKSMFSSAKKLSTLQGLENWNVSNLVDMGGMFVNCSGLTNLNAISSWNVSSVTNYGFPSGDNSSGQIGTFSGCTNLTDASGINGWNIKSTANFTNMFYNTPVHPTFTRVSGTWNSEGTFVPS